MLTVGSFLLMKKIKRKSKKNLIKESTGIEDSKSDGNLNSNIFNSNSSIINNGKLNSKLLILIEFSHLYII